MKIINEKAETVSTDQLVPHPKNPRQGDVGAIAESIKENGWYGTIIAQQGTNFILAGNHRWQAAQQLGMQEVPVTWVDVDSETALRILLADNRTSDLATHNDDVLAEILKDLYQENGLLGTGYDGDDLDSLIQKIAFDALDPVKVPHPKIGAPPPGITLVLSFANMAFWVVGLEMGFKAGCENSAASVFRRLKLAVPAARKPIGFIDNPYKGYSHSKHLAVVSEFKPIFATTRDLMTKEQCQDAGIEFFSIEEVLAQAEEIAAHTENVIIIPKYDCLDKIPETIGNARVVLGYSVKSSYGVTPLPIEVFNQRPTWLLGGSWRSQIECLDEIGNAVVGLDNNMVAKICWFGSYYKRNGDSGNVTDLMEVPNVAGHPQVALIASLSNMLTTLRDDYEQVFQPHSIDNFAENIKLDEKNYPVFSESEER